MSLDNLSSRTDFAIWAIENLSYNEALELLEFAGYEKRETIGIEWKLQALRREVKNLFDSNYLSVEDIIGE